MKRVFVSFDFDNDENLKHALVAQAKNPDSPFSIADYSVKERMAGDWQEKVRRRIRMVDVSIVICGEHTDQARGVATELKITREEQKPYFLLRGRPDRNCKKPITALETDKIYEWTWDNLKSLIGGARWPMVDSHDGDLIRKDRSYDDPLTTAVIEQYKAYVQTADNVSARRVSTSRYLLTLSVALIAAYGFQLSFPDNLYVVALAPVGVGVSCLWLGIIKSYRDLNRVKFKLIHELEQHLPANLFTREWCMTEKGDKSYTSVTNIERVVPCVFMGINFLLLIFTLLPKS